MLIWILGGLALLSVLLLVWQWVAARGFRLHERLPGHAFPLAVTLLKPLKGSEQTTEQCLRSWFAQEYTGRVQILLGVATADDPVNAVVRKLQQEFPQSDSQLVVCGPLVGTNAKVSKLSQLEKLAKHDLLVISDADVQVPPDLLANIVEPFRREVTGARCGLVNCFYRLANPTTLAMHWEAIAINADFWSQVLQAKSLKPLDFALGAVMAIRRPGLQQIGGFDALANCLADDYQLGHRLARNGYSIELSPVVVECWSAPMSWSAVWKHQLRWARTIRVCQPVAYFFSILSNTTLWPLLWFLLAPSAGALSCFLGCILVRIVACVDLQHRLTRSWAGLPWSWLAPIKDLLQAAIWFFSFTGNIIEWRGERMRLKRDGTLVKL